MRTLHFYCSEENPGPFETEQDESIADGLLTTPMLSYAVAHCGTGKPPFKDRVPRDMMFGGTWRIPHADIQFEIIDGRPRTDTWPYDVDTIECGDTKSIIHGRRCIPVSREEVEQL